MDIRQLKFFLAVVDHNGFSRAAEHLLVAQPSLSQAIATFERELGMPLFHRIGRGVVLSEAGAALVGPARVVLRDLDEAKATMRALKGLRGGRDRSGHHAVTGHGAADHDPHRVLRAHPDVTVNAEAAFTPEEVLALVRTGPPSRGPRVRRAHRRRRSRRRLAGTSSAGADLGARRRRSDRWTSFRATNLTGFRLIVSQRGSLMRALVDDVLASGVEITIVAEIAHRTSILPMVLNGLGPRRDARVVDRHRPVVPVPGCKPSRPSPTYTSRPSADGITSPRRRPR